jgi:hypothetical protein
MIAPIMIGASCPPPSNPFFLSLTTTTLDVTTQVPNCVAGFVCVSIVNTACVDVDVALYVHDGFDPDLDYTSGAALACCPNPDTAVAACPCPRPGYQVGEAQLTRPELFTDVNQTPIQGEDVRMLQPRESVLLQIQEGDIKSFGIALGRVGTVPAAPEIRDGPRYRCTLVAIPETISAPGGSARAEEDVPSGETFQFKIYDQSNCAAPGLAQLATSAATSSSGGCPPVQ